MSQRSLTRREEAQSKLQSQSDDPNLLTTRMLTTLPHLTPAQSSLTNQFTERTLRKESITAKLCFLIQIKLWSITRSRTYLVGQLLTISHRWCKPHLFSTTSTKSKLSHWRMLLEAYSTSNQNKRGKFLLSFLRFHANHKAKPAFSESGEITTILTLRLTDLWRLLPKFNHRLWIPAESSGLQLPRMVYRW